MATGTERLQVAFEDRVTWATELTEGVAKGLEIGACGMPMAFPWAMDYADKHAESTL